MKSSMFSLVALLLAATASQAAEGRLVSYRCDNGELISVTYMPRQALLNYHDKVTILETTAGGARHVNGPYVLWNRGREAGLEIDGRPELKNCRETRDGLDAPPAFSLEEGAAVRSGNPR